MLEPVGQGLNAARGLGTSEIARRGIAALPHHSMAITPAERFNVADVRVCELAVEISEAQRREILEMDWLIDHIRQNGPASTAEEADARAVPTFDTPADRDCPTG